MKERKQPSPKSTGGHSRQRVDLKGQRFGLLTVLAPAENIDGRTAWLCRCDCGREVVKKTLYLRDGRVKSCGCIRKNGIANYLTYIDGTCVEMLQAKNVRKNNKSGAPGVDWRASRHCWRAAICFRGKRYHLGSYDYFEDAVNARREAEKEFHDKFLAEFARAEIPPMADS